MVKEILRRDPDKEVSYTELSQRALREILCRDLAKRSLTKILPKKLLWRVCAEIPSRVLLRDLFWTKILPGHRTPVLEILYRDISQRSAAEILPRDL